MSKQVSLYLLLGVFGLALPAGAQETPRDQIVVTAGRLDAAPGASTGAVSVLTEEDLLRRQTAFIADALATLPGVSVSQSGGFGGQASVRIRGAASEQTLVLIDGVAVNDPTSPGGGLDAAFLDPNDVARIEVLRGPQSTLWGSDAIGGVINLVTRRPADGFSGGGYLEAGSFGTLRTGGSFGYGGKRLDARLGGALTGSDGISKADARDGNTETDDYDNATLDGRIGFQATPALRLEAFGRYSDSRNSFDGFGAETGVTDSDLRGRTEEASGGLAARLNQLDGRLEHLLIASRAEIERRNFDGDTPGFGADGSRETLRYQGTARPFQNSAFAFGAEREETKVEGTGSVSIDSLFLLAEVTPLAPLTFSAGIRQDDHSTFGDVATGRLGARFTPVEAVSFRASWGQGFKAPTVFQLTSAFGTLPANAALKPEEAEGWDAAIELKLPGDRLALEVGYFELETTNQIDFDFGSLRYENIAAVETSGIEAAARLRATDTLTLAATYTFTEAVDATGAPLLRVPDHAAFIEADWAMTRRLALTATLRHNGEEPDSNFGPFPAVSLTNDAWTRLDLGGRYRLENGFEFYARIENLTDEAYQDVFGYGTPGRAIHAGARVRFD